MIRKETFFLIALILVPTLLGSTKNEFTSAFETNSNSLGEARTSSVNISSIAPDFNITDVDSDVTYSLSQFLGNFVLIDLWATWCTPCEISLPMIRQLYGRYANNLTVISVDVDNSETAIGVSNFRDSHKMDWIVGIDYDESIDAVYGTGAIPTFYLLNTTGHVVYFSIGIDVDNFYNDLYTIISAEVPDDVTTPTFNEFYVTNSTELSIFNPAVRVIANISEESHLTTLSVTMNSIQGTIVTPLGYEKVNGYCLVNQVLIYDVDFIYPLENMSYTIHTEDFWSHTNTSETVVVNVTQYADAGPPTYSNVTVGYEELSDSVFNVTIYAIITEDLMLTSAYVRLKKGTSTMVVAFFEEFNSTFMAASATVLYSRSQPYELKAELFLEDIGGNEVTVEFTVAEEPETSKTSFEYWLVFVSLFSSIIILREFRKRD